MNCKSIQLHRVVPDSALVSQFLPGRLKSLRAVPVFIAGGTAHIVFVPDELRDPSATTCDQGDWQPSPRVIEFFRKALGVKGKYHAVTGHDFRTWFRSIIAEGFGAPAIQNNGADSVHEVVQLLKAASRRRASDVHLTPDYHGMRVQFRVDGKLFEQTSVHNPLSQQIVNRIKVLGGMDIAEKRQPQDGRFSMGLEGANFEIRAATIPSRHGEKITLRLLRQASEVPNFSALGFTPHQAEVFSQQLELPSGLVLLTGPTGSGKSTTMHSAITQLLRNRGGNVITVEDPIEYEIESATQIQVSPKDKLTFPTALRSILRHDPDTIMIGEIRDSETAQLAVQAALTGHLVLSTLHANSAAGVFSRLCDLGVEPFLVRETLRAVLAQRLVRRLCTDCRARVPNANQGYSPEGCIYCAGTGTHGRIGIFELLRYVCGEVVGDSLTHAATENVDAAAAEIATCPISTTYAEARLSSKASGSFHLRNGTTWAAEVCTVLGEADYANL